MLTSWFSQPQGARSSTDEARIDANDADTEVVEPDQGNGTLSIADRAVLSRHSIKSEPNFTIVL